MCYAYIAILEKDAKNVRRKKSCLNLGRIEDHGSSKLYQEFFLHGQASGFPSNDEKLLSCSNADALNESALAKRRVAGLIRYSGSTSIATVLVVSTYSTNQDALRSATTLSNKCFEPL
jgi:hypothetical protein